MATFRTLLVAVMLVTTALFAVLGFRTTPVFAAGKENVTSIDVPATETVLVSDRTGPVNQEVTQADYDKLHDQYNVTPNGTPTITSKTLDTENVETDTGHSKKSYTKETTTWVISDTAPQPAKTATEPASQENPARDNVDLVPLLLVPVTTAIVAPLAAVPAAVATAIPAAIVGGIANAVPAAVVGGALAAVPAALVGGALTALPAAVAGSALTALPAAIAGSALTVLPSALTGAALATAPALLKGYNDGFKDGFKLGDLLGTLKTVLPAALLGATLNAVPAALVGAALAVPFAAVKAAIPAFIAGTLLGNLVAFPAGVIAGAVPVAVISALVGLDVLSHVLPLIPLAFTAGVALPLLTAAAVLPFAVAAKLAADFLLALPVVGTIALLAGLNGLKDFVVIPALVVLGIVIPGVVRLVVLPLVLNGALLLEKVAFDQLVRNPLIALLVLDALKDAALANLLFDALKAKAAFDLFVRNPLLLKALAKHAKKLAVKAFKDGFKLATLLNKKALADAAVKALLGLKALNDFVVEPLLKKTAFDLLVRNPLIVKALKAHAKKLAVKAFKDGFKLATLLNKKALADAAVKTLLGLKALNDFVIKPLLATKAFNDFVVKPLLGLKALNDFVIKPLLLQRILLGNLGALHALNNPLSFGGPLFRLAKGFALPLTEIAKDHLQDLAKVTLDNLARAASLSLRTLGALNALNDPLSFGGPLFRLAKGFVFPIPEIVKNQIQNAKELAFRNRGLRHAVVNPLSFGDPIFRAVKGFAFPRTEIAKDHLQDLANLLQLKNGIDWLITNIELLKLLSNPPVILSQLLVIGKPLYELNRDIIAFVLLDAVGQLIFPFNLMWGFNNVRQITTDLYKITRANINFLILDAILAAVGIPADNFAFLSGVQIFEHMEEALGRTFIDREIAGFAFAVAASAALLPLVAIRDGLVTIALIGSVAFPIIKGTINAIQNLQSIAKIILFGNGWLITNIELLKVFNNLPVVITQVFVVGKLVAEIVRDLVVFMGIDIALQAIFPAPADFVFHFILQAVVDFSEMALLHAYILPYMQVEHVTLDAMRTIVDKELAGFIGASLISAGLLAIVIPLDVLSTLIINGNPLTHLI